MTDLCTIEECCKVRYRRDWCRKHYAHWQQYGDPLAGKTNTSRSEPMEYFNFWVGEWTEDCMVWPYALGGGGYGLLRVNGDMKPVHNLACEFYWGPMPEPKMQAAHGPCHTRACWNGQHVSWKTPKENTADQLRDGTRGLGEESHRAVLTADDVLAIRAAIEVGIEQKHLAKIYGVDTSTIYLIVKRKNWKHI